MEGFKLLPIMPSHCWFYKVEVYGDHHKMWWQTTLSLTKRLKNPSHKVIMHYVLTPPPFLLVIAT